jgi:hypothetical protein
MLPARHNLRANSVHHVAQKVVDQAAFLVAMWAYNQNEFYLDEGMQDRSKLRGELFLFLLALLSCMFFASCLLPSFMSPSLLHVLCLPFCLPYSLPRSSSVFLSCHPYAFHISLTPTRCRRGRSRPRPLRHQGMASPFRGCRGRFTLGPAGLLTARSHLHALRGYSHWQVPRIRRLEYRT